MRREEIESGLVRVIDALRGHLPAEQAQDMLDLTRAGEPGVALENLCTQLAEYEVAISLPLYDQIRLLGKAMQLDETYWVGLKRNK